MEKDLKTKILGFVLYASFAALGLSAGAYTMAWHNDFSSLGGAPFLQIGGIYLYSPYTFFTLTFALGEDNLALSSGHLVASIIIGIGGHAGLLLQTYLKKGSDRRIDAFGNAAFASKSEINKGG